MWSYNAAGIERVYKNSFLTLHFISFSSSRSNRAFFSLNFFFLCLYFIFFNVEAIAAEHLKKFLSLFCFSEQILRIVARLNLIIVYVKRPYLPYRTRCLSLPSFEDIYMSFA